MRNKLLLGVGLISIWQSLHPIVGLIFLGLGLYLILYKEKIKPVNKILVREIEQIKIKLDQHKNIL